MAAVNLLRSRSLERHALSIKVFRGAVHPPNSGRIFLGNRLPILNRGRFDENELRPPRGLDMQRPRSLDLLLSRHSWL